MTESAAREVRAHIAMTKDASPLTHGLRVSAVGGGCAGFQYDLSIDEPAGDDLQCHSHGVMVLVDSQMLPLLGGITIDYEDGLNGSGFRIDNPNAAGGCGCGKSFDAAPCGSGA